MSGDKPEELDTSLEDINARLPIVVAVVASRYNGKWVDRLFQRVKATLVELGIEADDVHLYQVPGAHEIPFLTKRIAESQFYDAIITLGVVLAGETDHHKVITQSAAHMLMEIACDEDVPVINGILTVEDEGQLEDRIGEKYDRGAEFARAALETIAAAEEVSGVTTYENQFLAEMLDMDASDEESDADWFKGN